MNKISIKEAIASGAWYECRILIYNEPVDFRLRILKFERKSVAEIDPNPAVPVVAEGVLWLLAIEAVNLTKVPVSGESLRDSTKVLDGDGFEFPPFARGSLQFDEDSGLRRFSCMGPPMSPKMKARGAIAFDLPDEENAYFLAFNKGSVREA